MMGASLQFGELLREWRQRRRLSQLHLAAEIEISQRHLSFLESGRSVPSREMVLKLADGIAMPLRDRNQLLVAAGFAPIYAERTLADPALAPAREAVELILAGHEPYPALAVDRRWQLVRANKAVAPLLVGVESQLMEPPVNVLRLSLHPGGLAGRIANYPQWRAHILARLVRQIDASGDPDLGRLLAELKAYPKPPQTGMHRHSGAADLAGIAVPLQLKTPDGVLSFISTTTVFGTPVDITLSELAIESFFPSDQATAEAMRRLLRDV